MRLSYKRDARGSERGAGIGAGATIHGSGGRVRNLVGNGGSGARDRRIWARAGRVRRHFGAITTLRKGLRVTLVLALGRNWNLY